MILRNEIRKRVLDVIGALQRFEIETDFGRIRGLIASRYAQSTNVLAELFNYTHVAMRGWYRIITKREGDALFTIGSPEELAWLLYMGWVTAFTTFLHSIGLIIRAAEQHELFRAARFFLGNVKMSPMIGDSMKPVIANHVALMSLELAETAGIGDVVCYPIDPSNLVCHAVVAAFEAECPLALKRCRWIAVAPLSDTNVEIVLPKCAPLYLVLALFELNELEKTSIAELAQAVVSSAATPYIKQ